MNETTSRLDKTLGDLTARDVIIIGGCILAVRTVNRIFHAGMAPTYRKWTRQLDEKREQLRDERNAEKRV